MFCDLCQLFLSSWSGIIFGFTTSCPAHAQFELRFNTGDALFFLFLFFFVQSSSLLTLTKDSNLTRFGSINWDLQRMKCQIFCLARRSSLRRRDSVPGESGFSGHPSAGENPSLRHFLASFNFLEQNASRRWNSRGVIWPEAWSSWNRFRTDRLNNN